MFHTPSTTMLQIYLIFFNSPLDNKISKVLLNKYDTMLAAYHKVTRFDGVYFIDLNQLIVINFFAICVTLEKVKMCNKNFREYY